ncbi:MAG TPA: AMP-binding protein, partial [Pyrinomonadaceae bacterium]
LTHRNIVANLCQFKGAGFDWADDTLLCVLPMFHIYGLVAVLNYGLYCGATIITLPRFDLEQALGVMQDYKVSIAHLVPPVVLALAKHPVVERYDLSSVKTVFSGAAPLGEQLSRACCERLGCRIIQGYGMTETSPATHLTSHEHSKHGSVGLPVPYTECRIVCLETGVELGTGAAGEICIRGPQVMKGYLGRPEATAETIDEEGWLRTGDIGYADDEGFFFIVDRAKELIKYKGFQVAPAELEALLLTHPSVADAAVIPSPDEEAGEIPKAFVVLKNGASATAEDAATAEELISYVAARVAPHKKIRLLEFVEQIPKSPSGKILRRTLVQKERERRAGN